MLISGIELPLSPPYSPGDEINDAEAAVLNAQWERELRSAFAPIIRSVMPLDDDKIIGLRAQFQDFAVDFKLGTVPSHITEATAVFAIACQLARKDLLALLNRENMTLSQSGLQSRVIAIVTKNQSYLARARKLHSGVAAVAVRELVALDASR